jgi:hypothetical protein
MEEGEKKAAAPATGSYSGWPNNSSAGGWPNNSASAASAPTNVEGGNFQIFKITSMEIKKATGCFSAGTQGNLNVTIQGKTYSIFIGKEMDAVQHIIDEFTARK